MFTAANWLSFAATDWEWEVWFLQRFFCCKLQFISAIVKAEFEGQAWVFFKPNLLVLKAEFRDQSSTTPAKLKDIKDSAKAKLAGCPSKLKINSTLLQSFFFSVRFKVLTSFHSWSFSSWFWSQPKRLCKSSLNNTRRGQFCVAGVFSRKGFPRINSVFQSCDWYLLFSALKFLFYL